MQKLINIVILSFIGSVISGCATRPAVVRDLFELSANPLELSQMDAGEVCKEVGFETHRGRTRGYLAAKAEAEKRIRAYEVSAEDCVVFAQMGVRQEQRQAASVEAGLQRTQPTQTTCNPNGLGGFVCNGY